jgi:hypothetical protein
VRYLGEGIAYTAERDLDLIRLYMPAWQSIASLYLGDWTDATNTGAEVLRLP